MKTTLRLIDTLLSSARRVFASARATNPVPKTYQPQLEALETREVPSSAQAAQLFRREMASYGQAALYVQQAGRDWGTVQDLLSNGSKALQELNTAKTFMGQTILLELARYKIGAVTKTQFRRDLAVLSQAAMAVNNDLQTVQASYSGIFGGARVNGIPLTMLPNFFGGANMLP